MNKPVSAHEAILSDLSFLLSVRIRRHVALSARRGRTFSGAVFDLITPNQLIRKWARAKRAKSGSQSASRYRLSLKAKRVSSWYKPQVCRLCSSHKPVGLLHLAVKVCSLGGKHKSNRYPRPWETAYQQPCNSLCRPDHKLAYT